MPRRGIRGAKNVSRRGQPTAKRGRGSLHYSSNSRARSSPSAPVSDTETTAKLTAQNCTLCDSPISSHCPYESSLDKYFECFCTFLDVTVPDEFSWNFKQEKFPFCNLCLNILKTLTQLYERLEKTHYEVAGLVSKVKKMVIRTCYYSNFKDVRMTDLDRDGKRVYFVRRQIASDDDLQSEPIPDDEEEIKSAPFQDENYTDLASTDDNSITPKPQIKSNVSSLISENELSQESQTGKMSVDDENGSATGKSLFDQYVDEQLILLNLQEDDSSTEDNHEAVEIDEVENGDHVESIQQDVPVNLEKLLVNLVEVPKPNWQMVHSKCGFEYGGISIKLENRTYFCSKCSASLSSKEDTVEHLELEHLGSSHWYPCEICYQLCRTVSILRDHVSFVHKQKEKRWDYRCVFCSKFFYSENMRDDHIRAHDKLIKNSDEIAEEMMEQLFRQGIVFSDGVFNCDLFEQKIKCTSSFDSLLTISNHIYNDHSDVQKQISRRKVKLLCGACGEILVKKTDMENHFSRLHLSGKSNVCLLCSSNFNSLTEMIEHQQMAHGGVATEKLCKIYFPEGDISNLLHVEEPAPILELALPDTVEQTERKSLRPRRNKRIKYVDTDDDVQEDEQDKTFSVETVNVSDSDDDTYVDEFQSRPKRNSRKRTRKQAKYFDQSASTLPIIQHQEIGKKAIYSCVYCGFGVIARNPAKAHYIKYHRNLPPGTEHTCHICSESFESLELLRNHQKEHIESQKLSTLKISFYFPENDANLSSLEKETESVSITSDRQTDSCTLCPHTTHAPEEIIL